MSETEQSPPQSDTSAAAAEHSNFSFSLWPPCERTRDAVRKRLIENLSTPSILSNKYGIVSYEEAINVAKLVEEDAFDVAAIETGTDDYGIEILQVYSKEISKRMLDTMKARFGELAKAERVEYDAGPTALLQSEKVESVSND
ncbi:mfp1 attachment factor 1 [Phtheirospermum japonicum]|uniref:Mfp1 attachment factor 1 n=1 Tax=Phtheirospermum japonicum TaxID=374723 RepID=A0A830CZD7_9LAMI|nr:mfp1 attachment factor 1 [Phtheirospermum japonicum]